MNLYKLPVFSFLLLPLLSTATDNRDTVIKGVNTSFNYNAEIFPPEWQKSPISAKAGAIDPAEINRSKAVSMKALRKYPTALLQSNLKAIYWLKKMSFYDVGYGGTNSTDALYLTNDGIVMGYTDDYLEQTFHHEFSSILFRNYPQLFDTTGWKAATRKGFDYNDPENGVGAIRNNASSQDLDTALCKKGMLTQYAMSSMENDVNTFAQNMFCPSEGFWEIVDSFPRIAKKTRLLISFYNKINPIYTEDYFRKLKAK